MNDLLLLSNLMKHIYTFLSKTVTYPAPIAVTISSHFDILDFSPFPMTGFLKILFYGISTKKYGISTIKFWILCINKKIKQKTIYKYNN